MTRYVYATLLFLFVLLVIVPASFGCGRCGIFGRGCRFAAPVHHAPVHHAAPVIKAPDTIQNFVFNNIAPPGDLAPRGATVYGLSRALEYNAPNSALYLDNARRALEFAGDTTVSARTIDTLTLDAAAVDARGRAVEAAFRSLAPDSAAVTRSTTTRVTIKNGFPVIDELSPLPRNLKGDAEHAPITRHDATISCLKCHAVDGPAASKFVIDDTFDEVKFTRAKAAIDAGTMPPKTNLSEAERARELLKLGRLVPMQ